MPDEEFKRLLVNMLTGHIDTNKISSMKGLKKKDRKTTMWMKR